MNCRISLTASMLCLALLLSACGQVSTDASTPATNLDAGDDTGDALPFNPQDLFVPIDLCEQECKTCLCTCNGEMMSTGEGGCWQPCTETEPVCSDCPTWCAAQVDAGPADAGAPDAGTPDAGAPDAGTPDAGAPDAGTPQKCQPVCGAIGSKSEGWQDSCTGKLLTKPGGGIYWDQCAKCKPTCKLKGSKSEGWYSSCTGALIAWDNCFKQWCIPYCGAIGTKSEGWFGGCTEALLDDPLGSGKLWGQCAKCNAVCDKTGTKSEGWYDSCTQKLLRWAQCD